MRHLSQLRLHPRTVLVDVRFVMFCCYVLFTVIYIAARWLALCRCCWIVSVLCMLLCIKRCGVNVRFFLGRIAVASSRSRRLTRRRRRKNHDAHSRDHIVVLVFIFCCTKRLPEHITIAHHCGQLLAFTIIKLQRGRNSRYTVRSLESV